MKAILTIATLLLAIQSTIADARHSPRQLDRSPLPVPDNEGSASLLIDCPNRKDLTDKVGKKRLVVVLSEQKLYAYDGSTIPTVYNIVTGRKGKPTDPGEFRIFLKRRFYINRAGANMPYAMFFTDDRKALHTGDIRMREEKLRQLKVLMDKTGQPIRIAESKVLGSHGCIRLKDDEARKLFEWTPLCTPVQVLIKPMTYEDIIVRWIKSW